MTLPTMLTKRLGILIVWLLSAPFAAYGQNGHITAAQAKDHVGEHTTVCGAVASTRYANRSRGQPTFLNLDESYPNQIFTIVIWGSDRPKFGQPEAMYRDKAVCVTGEITSYRGVPEIAAHEPKQIAVQR